MTDLTAPLGRTLATPIEPATAATDASGTYIRAPFTGRVSGVSVIAGTTLTGANTNSRTLQLFNRGQAGVGTTLIAEKAFTLGVNATADDETDIPLSAVAGATSVVEGDVLEFVSLHVGGTGLAAPPFTALVTFTAGSPA